MKSFFFIIFTFVNLNIYPKIVLEYDSSFKKNAVKIDLYSLHNTLFDARKQIRVGAEFESKISKKINLSSHLDFGLYDDYNFIKNS